MKVLVTGGAGYIGSHVTRQLGETGHDVVVIDNLSTGRPWAVLGAELVVGDLGDAALLSALFDRHAFDAVLHFAASVRVDESVTLPVAYYRNNVANMLQLLECVVRYGVAHFVFSSSASVYGNPTAERIDEAAPLAPINPYGATKVMGERLLADLATADARFRYVSLRYFNVAGADALARIGEATPHATHLVKVACQAAAGIRKEVEIYGTDYPTPDGTCVRDYIHVEDLARAHLDALAYLDRGGEPATLNCGYGRGYSVREVLAAAHEVTGTAFPVREGPRRAGDPPRLVAGCERIGRTLGWRPRYDDLATIMAHAWAWEQALARRPQARAGARGGS